MPGRFIVLAFGVALAWTGTCGPALALWPLPWCFKIPPFDDTFVSVPETYRRHPASGLGTRHRRRADRAGKRLPGRGGAAESGSRSCPKSATCRCSAAAKSIRTPAPAAADVSHPRCRTAATSPSSSWIVRPQPQRRQPHGQPRRSGKSWAPSRPGNEPIGGRRRSWSAFACSMREPKHQPGRARHGAAGCGRPGRGCRAGWA